MEKKKLFFKEKPVIYVLLGIMFICLIGGLIEGFLWNDFSSLKYSSAFNVVVDIFGMIIGFIIYIGAYHDRTKVRREIILFLLLIFFDYINMFLDLTGWMLDGRSSLRILNLLSNSLYYIIGYVTVDIFWHYVKATVMNEDSRLVQVITKIVDIIAIVSSALILINIYSGTLFTVTEDGVYARQQLYLITILDPVIDFAIFAYLISQSKLPLKQIFTLLLFLVVPLASVIIQSFCYGFSLIYPSLMCAILAIYCNYHVSRSIELFSTRDEITKQKITYMMNQVHPRFIYNELKTILFLSDTDGLKAKEAITDLSLYLKENLDAIEKEPMIPFEEEIKLVRLYARIEKAKYPFVDVEIENENENFMIPRYSIVPLVENAIKHGIIPMSRPGKVKISLQRVANGQKIIVEDDGQGFAAGWNFRPNKHTPSLQNLEYRIKALTKGTLTISSKINVGTTAVIFIPSEEE